MGCASRPRCVLDVIHLAIFIIFYISNFNFYPGKLYEMVDAIKTNIQLSIEERARKERQFARERQGFLREE